VPDSVSADSAQAKILRLLRVLHALDADARSMSLVPASLVGEGGVRQQQADGSQLDC
jgi:hypothetical protein